MKLRTGLARALVTNPEYVLYDEPNAGLDPIISHQIHELIIEVRDRLGVTGLIVTHSRACATQCGDRIGILENGRLAVEGTVDEMTRSDHPLARAFLGGGTD
jgi:phospholipid/cholesterol/gamma-HCH transport system ATP-binding protein